MEAKIVDPESGELLWDELDGGALAGRIVVERRWSCGTVSFVSQCSGVFIEKVAGLWADRRGGTTNGFLGVFR